MTVKSVVDVDINDAAFLRFHALFDKYQAALAKTPEQWSKVDGTVKGTALTVESLVAGLAAQSESTRKANAEARKATEEAKKRAQLEADVAKGFQRSAVYAKDIAKSVGAATISLLRWSGPIALFSGLLGVGGLFGLDRLAGDVGFGRRAAQGLGTSIGARQSFETNYGRLVDPGQFLGGVNSSLTDVTQRYKLYGAGLTESDIAGKDTTQVAQLLVGALKKIADATPTAQLAQVLKARGLDQFASVQDLERLKATSPEELSSIGARYGRDKRAFDLSDATARKWQDLSVGLSEAKNNIEAAFVRGLVPLIPAITRLSGNVAQAVTNFFANPHLQDDIKGIGKGIDSLGKYLGSPKFEKDVKTFADDVSYAAEKIAGALKWLGLIPDREQQEKDKAASDRVAALFKNGGKPTMAQIQAARNDPTNPWTNSDPNRQFHWYDPGSYMSNNGGLGSLFSGRNNPGNIKNVSGFGFRVFKTVDDGLRAVAKQIQIYGKRDHLDTIQGIISKYAPPSENDTAAYIKDVAGRTGFKADEHLNLNDTGVLAKLVAAITKHENRKNNFTPEVVVKVLNNTGGSAVVQTNQAAK